MKNKKLLLILWIVLGSLLLGLIYFGIQNREDPLWTYTKSISNTSIADLASESEQLEKDFVEWHPGAPFGSARNTLSRPFFPDLLYEEFKVNLDYLSKEHWLVLGGVTGAGATSFAQALANFIAGSTDRVLDIPCAPEYDLLLHEKYINTFGISQGILLDFIEKATKNPSKKYVVQIQNLDKINPETFFGPQIWEELGNSQPTFMLFGKTFAIPENIYFISTVHLGEASKIHLSNEHFKRIGRLVKIQPNVAILNLYLQRTLKEKNGTLSPELQHSFLYRFAKINEIIQRKYGEEFTLGQWSNVRKLYMENDQVQMDQLFEDHVNSLSSDSQFDQNTLKSLHYALSNQGQLKDSNMLSRTFATMEEKGFLTEFVVGLSFLLVSGIFSYFLFNKRQSYIKKYTEDVRLLIEEFEGSNKSYDEISLKFSDLKSAVDQLIFQKKISYTEATFFYNFIEEKIKRIEMARQANMNFDQLVDTFLDDGQLSQSEYEKLLAYLERVKLKIRINDYLNFKEKVENLYKKYGEHN